MSNQEIQVLFIDASTGKAFAQTLLPAEQLPETFELSTTLTIAGQDWSVINAEPQRAEDFRQTGKLVLTLSKISLMNPKDILYTLPTICSAIPAIAPGTSRHSKQVFEIHEDDWQQIEFVSRIYGDAIDTQLAEIRRIYDEASTDNGDFLAFKRLAPRMQITNTISSAIPLSQLVALLPEPQLYDGISYPQELGLIKGGFAYKVSNSILYGQATNGLVQILALHGMPGESEAVPALAPAFASMMSRYELYLVDWCTMTLLEPEARAIQDYLHARQHTRLLPRRIR
jgi:hypothetical protein